MKKIHMISVLLAMLMPMMVFGNSHSKHYGEIKVIKQSGEGTVYIATANNATSGKASDTWNCGGSSSNDSKAFYIFAKPETGNEFLGWTDNSTSGTPNNQGTFSNGAYYRNVTPNAQNGTTTYYAHFIRYYNIKLATPNDSAGFNGYTYSGNGINGTQSSAGGEEVKVYDGKTYTFTCNLSDTRAYKFAGWDIGGTTVSAENPYSTEFSANATIKAVIEEKAHGTVTLAAPVGGSASYAVSGDKGFDGAGLAVGDNFKAYYDEKYTFTCNIADSSYELARWEITENGTTATRDTATLEWTFTPDVATSVRAVLNRKAEYQLTLSAKPVGVLSYDVSGPNGADELSSNGGGSMSFLGASDFTFSCTMDPAYKFDGWNVTDSSGTTNHYSESVLEKRFADTVIVTPQVSLKATYELTFDKPEQVTRFSIIGPDGPVPISSEDKATVYELDEYQITCVFDEENWELVKWTIRDSNGTTEPTTGTINNKTFTSDARVTVTLNKVEAFIATCLTVPSGCSYKVESTTVNTTEQKVRGEKGQPLIVTLSAATAGSGYVFAGWYIENQDGSKTYISKDSSVTQTFNSHVRLGADFVSSSSSKTARVMKADGGYVEYDDLSAAFIGLGAGDSMTIYKSAALSQNALVPYDASLTISQGVTVTIASGTCLKVAGTITNNGTISGSGTIALSYKTVTQESTINVPFPYGTDGVETGTGWDKTDGTGDGTAGKYVKTHVSTGISSINNCTVQSTQWFVTLVNGDGESFMTEVSAEKPVGILCKVNRKRALNWVMTVVDSYGSISTMEAALDVGSGSSKDIATFPAGEGGDKNGSYSNVKDNEYMVVLLEDCSNFFNSITANIATGFAMDCAGNSFTIKNTSYQAGSNFLFRFFNASSITFQFKYILRPHMNFYGCPTVTVKSFRKDYPTSVSLYDSGTTSFTFSSSESGSSGARINIYGGSKYSSSVIQSGLTKIYWGTFDADRSTYLADTNRYKMTKENNNTYVVEKHSGSASHPFKVGTTEKDSLSDAIALAKTTGDKIVQQKDFVLAEQVVVPADADVALDLSGWNMSGTGSILNRGTFEIVDDSGSVVASILSVPVICESGNTYLSGATFESMITAGPGKCWFLDGTFNGGITVAGSNAEVTDAAQIISGTFASNVYVRDNESHTLLDLCPNGRMVVSSSSCLLATIPQAYLSGTSTYTIKAFDPNTNDETLYKTSKSSTKKSSYSSRSEWIRAIELYAQATVFAGWGIDCTIVFDRKVPAGSITATAASNNITLDSEAKANEVKSVLLPKLRELSQGGSTQWGNFGPWTYSSFLPGGDHANQISMSISNSQTTNNGTSCKLQMRLANNIKWQSGKKDWSYDIANGSVVIAEKYFVIGAGSDKAMIRPDVGGATFYATLASALTSVTNNGTVMLANDCAENVTVAKECTIVVNEFNFTGSVTVADGYQVAFADGAYVVTKLGPSHPADYVVIPSEHLQEWKSDNGITGSTESEIRDALKQEDENHIPKWENVVMGQNGATPPAIETSTNGTDEVAEMVVSFNPPSNIGYTVKYAFDKTDSTGTVVENGAGEAQATPELHLTEVTTAGTPSYFKMRAVLESNDGNHAITTNVPVDKVIGVLKVDSDATFTILAVPWKSFDGGNVKVSELVHAASLSTDDMLYAYDGNGNLESWRVKDGVWVSMKETAGGEQGTTAESDPPAEFGLARGKGVWLKRKDTASPIYLLGLPPTSGETAQTALAPAKDGEPSWNLVASPKLEAVDIATGAFKDNTSDEIIVPTASTPKHYTYKNGAWGYPGATVTEQKTLPNDKTVDVIKTEHKTDDTAITPGTGFWYLNRGTESKTINW